MPSTPTVEDAIAAFAPALPLTVALSGGADSTALLLACAARWPGQVRAVHVHHGLQSAADAFEQHCRALCARLGVPLTVCRVDARHAPGQSPEDAARRARYAAIAGAVRAAAGAGAGGAAAGDVGAAGDVRGPAATGDVALAQHADDQVETVLLALSRGAGLPGLAAMPGRWTREGLVWHRPLLAVPASALRDWLAARGEPWCEDPSNADLRYTRNRIRAQLLPALLAAFPQFRQTSARSARHAAQAQGLLDALGDQDLAATGMPPAIAGLRALDRARQANALRRWLTRAHGVAPSEAQLEELLDQLADCSTRGHRLRLKLAGGFVLRQGDRLSWQAPGDAPPGPAPAADGH